MKKGWYILFITMVVAGVALSARADDYYVDDAYYWTGSTREPIHTKDKAGTSSDETDDWNGITHQTNDWQEPEITFVEDSVTRADKTVVKAVIKRN